MKNNDLRRWLANWQAESEAVYLYLQLSEHEKNETLSGIYRRLAESENVHVKLWRDKIIASKEPIPAFKPRLKVRFLALLSRRMGAQAVIPMIAAIERSAASEYFGQPEPEIEKMTSEESSHSRVFQYIARSSAGMEGASVARWEGRHRTGGNALRAGVLGANDGLVSVFCLVMGVAGAGVGSHAVLVTGIAGLMACALSMALGEWLSVQNARELYANQLAIEAQELAEAPEEEREELVLIYQAKGVDRESAEHMAAQIFRDKNVTLDTLAREELSIDPGELGGSAWEAAVTSFFLCIVGGIIPVIPYIIFSGTNGLIASAAASAVGLFILGVLSAFVTGSNMARSGVRQILFGLAAAAVTFGIGKLAGTNLG